MKNISEDIIKKNWQSLNANPLVSICCTTFNHSKYIADALNGFLSQETTFPFEILIHDDASTDGTKEILIEYAKKFPTIIKLILQTENQFSKGIKAHTIAFKQCSGKYIAFCEGDDYWIDPLKIQTQLDYMELNNDLSLCFHNAWIHQYENGIKISEKNFIKNCDGRSIFTTRDLLLKEWFVPSASIFLKKSAYRILPNEWYKNIISGDLAILVLSSLNGDIGFINRNMSIYRKNSLGSLSANQKKPWLYLHKRVNLFAKFMNLLDKNLIPICILKITESYAIMLYSMLKYYTIRLLPKK